MPFGLINEIEKHSVAHRPSLYLTGKRGAVGLRQSPLVGVTKRKLRAGVFLSEARGILLTMQDHEKPRRSRAEEQQEIADSEAKRHAEIDGLMFGAVNRSLAGTVREMQADDEARLVARERAETPEEVEESRRIEREEAQIRAEIPLLHARERRRQAAAAARRADSSEYSRLAS